MNREHPRSVDGASASQLIESNRICDRFEEAWRAGRRPAIEDCLAGTAEPAQPELLRELLATELELRRSAGERPGVLEYRARFPGHATLVEAAFAWAERAAPGSPLPPPLADAGRNLLFGLLALQNNFIDRDALLAAFHAWLADKSRPLGTILRERGALDGTRHAILDALVGEHLRLHGGDPDRSLAALELGGSTRETLRKVGDPDLDASLLHAGSFSTNVDASDTFAGQPTSSGGRFRILRPHARGGLGQVYVARDQELGRQVALKEILADKAHNPWLRSRFLLEAEINGNLEHPGIVPVYGLGTYDDGRPFYAMRFIQGDSLKEAIEAYHAAAAALDPTASNLRLRQLLGRFVDVCDAIAYAHSRGVLHRDLKPGNIMLGAYGETLIIDWGLAKAVGHRDPASAGIETTLVPPSGDSREATGAGHLLGSPPYMSPEQAEGLLDHLGPATDVYGLGATLYALLTGKAPVAGATVEEVLSKVRKGSIVPPRQLNARVPRPLEAVCLKALALRPSDRYPSARALAGDIEHWLADEPVSALAEPLRDRARRWGRRHRTFVTTAAAVLLLGLAGLGAFATLVGDKNRRLVAANRATKQAETLADARLDRAMASIEDYFTGFSADALKGGQLPPALRDRLLAKPREFYEQLAKELTAKPNPSERERALLAKGQDSLGRILRMLGKNKEARTQDEAAVASFEALVARRPDVADYQNRLAMSHSSLGNVLAATGRADLAAGAYKKAITIYEALIARHPDGPDYQNGLANCHNNLGNLLGIAGRSDDAAGAYNEAITIYEALTARHPDLPEYQNGLANSHNSLANLLRTAGRSGEAAVALKKAVKIGDALVARHPDVPEYQTLLANSHNTLGSVLYTTGRSDEAAGAYKKAITIYNALAARHPDVPEYQKGLAASHMNLGNVLADTGRSDEAAGAYKKAVTINEALAARHPDIPEYQTFLAGSLMNLGTVLAATGRSDEAAGAYKNGVAIGEALVARYPDVPDYQMLLANSHFYLGELFRPAGRSEEAAVAFKKAATIYEPLVARYPDVPAYLDGLATSHLNLGIVFAGTSQPDQAAVAYKKAVTIFESMVAKHSNVPRFQNALAASHTNLGELLLAAGRPDEAAGAFKKAITIREALVARHPDVPEYQSGLAISHGNLGRQLKVQGNFVDALTEFRRAAKLAQRGTPVAADLPGLIRETENSLNLANRLPSILKGEDKPKDAAEGLAFAPLCYDQSRYAAATRLWINALAADPKLADDRQTQPRYNAACAAALAAAGKGKDEPALDAVAGGEFRAQARDWLKAELAAWTKVLETGPAQAKSAVAPTLQHWQQDIDLAGVRDPQALEKLPEAERKRWRDLWAEVGTLLNKARRKHP